MSLILEKIKIIRLEENTPIATFDCGDIDLNEFLLNDAKNYLESMLAVTCLVEFDNEIAAYFCLSCDGLTRSAIPTEEEKRHWNKVGRKIPNSKRRRTYPAVKIGRMAVAKKFAGSGLEKLLLLSIREMYIHKQHHAGCRFITVDAYRSALDFYEKNRFQFLTTKDVDEDTRTMYFDLKAI
ncbi:MAG: GNAT family N-acetyltransferase [Tannerella sp.]|jgi:GNAT superfamily N-acetyltransferase|nr:GNAT family N-acetyltransferase [Tannerella sp.]